ncbi:MAG TPA: bifunctional diaminohydroxyphosphoribosylaminopyrimidine deaminase/5-amino-6-(5-phosphoribosylamino)uracil reductase RibD [Verrucomicrobia bacterium]|nr:MAG: riboflavin biosynthesis protein RibD [Lentisphaerae bacterium GWF2_57_35]HBA85890.1 bifunctional diaminohydroxyphosphoribosylaminopyrimidine deaminase/5-amino-6-(5-phosphoribosylamino)uracil reductase RibD [Verrucomicrobiota bacterium]
MPRDDSTHEPWMRRALELARRGEGLTRPNPPVGAVVVAGSQVVGAGFHHRAGEPHAEALALDEAGARARGAALYVTLEPCSTWGRTPPCTDAILAAGISQVVVCVRDPNPAHAGRGLSMLKRKGLQVLHGVLADEGAELIAPFAKWIQSRIPYVTLKLGMTLDGRIADETGSSRWITGPQARRHVQDLRRRCDAVLVGRQTVCLDDPQLTPRPPRGRSPYRVVVAGRGEIPLSARILNDVFASHTIVAVTRNCPMDVCRAIESKGASVLVLPEKKGLISLKHLLQALGKLSLLHVLCEGGGELAAGLIADGLVDDYLFFVSPCLLGGRARNAVAGAGWKLGKNPQLVYRRVEKVGRDLLIRAAPAMEGG